MRLCGCHHCRRYLFGECFFELSKDSTDEMLEKQKSEVQEQIDSHKAELLTIRETLADLKGKLYGAHLDGGSPPSRAVRVGAPLVLTSPALRHSFVCSQVDLGRTSTWRSERPSRAHEAVGSKLRSSCSRPHPVCCAPSDPTRCRRAREPRRRRYDCIRIKHDSTPCVIILIRVRRPLS
jgi:hypothetical protein